MGLMKRILTIIFLLVLNFTLKAQILQQPNTYGIGWKRTGADTLLYIPSDTLQVPSWGVGKTHIAKKGTSLYYWDGSKWSAITGGSPNSNIGSGYRLAVPGTNNIKTLFGGYGIVWDSTSNSNGITGKVDTATVFPAVRATIPSGGSVDSVKVISDSVLVQYFGATPDTISTFQRYTITSPQHGQILKYDSTTKSWKNYDFTGGSSVTDSIRVYSGQFPATGNIGLDTAINRIRYRRISGEDTIIYTLAVQDSTIFSQPPQLVDITFPTSHSSHYVNTSGVITNIGGGASYNCTALSSLSLAADGYIQFQWNTGDQNAFLGFNDANSATGYTGMEAAMLVSGAGLVYRVDGGSYSSTGSSIANGNLVRISRIGSALTLDKSTDGGSNWTNLYNYTYSSSGTLYIVADLYEDAGTVMRYPKLYQ